MKKKIIILTICILLIAVILTGCTESYKAKALETDTSNPTVTSNGGLAVNYGKYMYYINGYAGNTVDNTFGDVQKGAIARVELDAKGNPISDTNVIVVPKNVYNTVATSGLYIVGDYIYYSTPSVDKDSSGAPKTSAMWLMRTKLDGTGTKVVKKFDDYTAVYKVVNGYVLYYLKNELHSIDLNSKKFEDSKITDEITAQYFTTYDGAVNSFVDTVFYLKANEDATKTSNVLWAYRAGNEPIKLIDEAAYGENLLYYGGYTLSITEAVYVGNGLRLIYSKTDSGAYTRSKGTYYYDLDENMTFDNTKEVRVSRDVTYSNFTFLGNDCAIVLNGTNYSLLNKANGKAWVDCTAETLIELSTAPTILSIDDNVDNVEVYFINSSKLYKMQVMAKNNGVYEKQVKSASLQFDGKYSTTWLGMDKVGSLVVYFNSDVKDNAYCFNLNAIKDRDAETRIPSLLGLMTAEDEIAMIG